MEFKIQNTDTHVVLDVPDLTEETIVEFPANELSGKSVIVNAYDLGPVGDDQINVIKQLINTNAPKTKFMVVVTENQIKDTDIPSNVVFLRSVEEGVDAIFMNDLENQFKEDIGS